MKLELRGITKRFGSPGRQRPHRPHRRAGRDPLPARRERRRQVHADERALRPVPGRRGRDPPRRRTSSTSPAPATPWPPASAWCTSTSCSSRCSPSPRTSCSATRQTKARRRARPRPPRARRCARSRHRFGFHVDPDALVEDLPVGVQQRVEIIKALSRDAKVLVFDEPTAVLTPQETDELMAIMRQLQDDGHLDRLHHPQAARGARGRRPHHRHPARQGRRRGLADGDRTPSSPRSWSAAPSSSPSHKDAPKLGDAALVVERPDASSTRIGQLVVERRRASTCDAARSSPSPACRATARPSSPRRSWACSTRVHGLHHARRHRARRARACARSSTPGVGFVPEDRTEDGLVGEFTIAENLMLDRANGAPFVRARQPAARRPRRLRTREGQGVRHPHPGHRRARCGRLSGGNQQKVVLARELSRDLRLLRRRAADPRRRRRLDRVHPQADRRDARRRRARGRRLDRARRGRRARRPHRGDVPRPHRRHRPRRHPARRARPDDGRRTPRRRSGRMSDPQQPPRRAGEPTRRRRRIEEPGAVSPRPAPPPTTPGRRRRRPSRRAAASRWHTMLREITTGNAIISVLAVVLALLVGADPDRVHRRATCRRQPGTSSPGPATRFAAIWESVSGAYSALFRGSVYNFRRADFVARHPAAHRDAHLRDPADRRRPRRRPRVPRRPVQHRWPRPDAHRRIRRRLGRRSRSTCRGAST